MKKMKKSMIDYISVLTEEDYDTLEDIIANKYKKFVTLYWILREFSSYIAMLQYKKSSPETMNIQIRFAGTDVLKLIKLLESEVSKYDNVLMDKYDGGIVNLLIEKDEAMPEMEILEN